MELHVMKCLIILMKISLALGAMFVQEETFFEVENGKQLVGKPVPFEKVISKRHCTMQCSMVDSCTGVSYDGEDCTGIITHNYSDDIVVHIATPTNPIFEKDHMPPDMCIHFEDLSELTMNGALPAAGYVSQGLDFGGTGQTADAGILKGKACFVTPQSCSNGFTLSLWAKIHPTNPDQSGFITTFETGKQSIHITRFGPALHFGMRTESEIYGIDIDFTGHWDKWTYLTLSMVVPGSDINIYYNGIHQASVPPIKMGPFPPNEGRLVFGKHGVDGNIWYGSAILDEVCSWNIILSEKQISKMYQSFN